MTSHFYQGFVPIPSGIQLNASATVTGILYYQTAVLIDSATPNVYATAIPVNFTNLALLTAAETEQLATFRAPNPIIVAPNATTTLFLRGDATVYRAGGLGQLVPATPVIIAQKDFALASATAATSTSNGSASGSSQTSGSVNTTSPPADTGNSGYGPGALAGAAVGCALGAALLTGLICFLLWRRKRSKYTNGKRRDLEKHVNPSRDHGEAVYVTENSTLGLEKRLPQADSDASVRAQASSTLDQIAMHVENFYSPRNQAVLSTEHKVELESIDTSHFSEPISTLLLRSRRQEDVIKHVVGSYILSMINFEGGATGSSFLPKAFRKQLPSPPRNQEGFDEAYSKWRVLTAFLQNNGGGEQAYTAERDAMIANAAAHVCKALEPWAKSGENTRYQNMVAIMKRASELGVLLFRQPARFEWQWQAPTTSRVAADVGWPVGLVVLPGLYKTTDQNGVPLTTPLRLVEPVLPVTGER